MPAHGRQTTVKSSLFLHVLGAITGNQCNMFDAFDCKAMEDAQKLWVTWIQVVMRKNTPQKREWFAGEIISGDVLGQILIEWDQGVWRVCPQLKSQERFRQKEKNNREHIVADGTRTRKVFFIPLYRSHVIKIEGNYTERRWVKNKSIRRMSKYKKWGKKIKVKLIKIRKNE